MAVGTKGEETFPPVVREGLITEGLALPHCGQTAGRLTATAGGAPRAWRRQASEMCTHPTGGWPVARTGRSTQEGSWQEGKLLTTLK